MNSVDLSARRTVNSLPTCSLHSRRRVQHGPQYAAIFQCLSFRETKSSQISTSSRSAIFCSSFRWGCDLLMHQLDTVCSFFSSWAARSFWLTPFLTSTSFILFILSSIKPKILNVSQLCTNERTVFNYVKVKCIFILH
jgi:hypothetical protein